MVSNSPLIGLNALHVDQKSHFGAFLISIDLPICVVIKEYALEKRWGLCPKITQIKAWEEAYQKMNNVMPLVGGGGGGQCIELMCVCFFFMFHMELVNWAIFIPFQRAPYTQLPCKFNSPLYVLILKIARLF